MKTRMMFFCCLAFCLAIGGNAFSAEGDSGPPKKVKISVKTVEGDVALGNTIRVTVKNLPNYLKQSGKDPTKFKLYLDWIKIDKVDAKVIPFREKDTDGVLIFKIKHDAADREAWSSLLGKPFSKERGNKTKVYVSVGYDKEPPVVIESNEANGNLLIYDPFYIGLFVFFMLVVLIIFAWLAVNTGIIRGPFPDVPLKKRPFSLGRAQMAFWFFMVASSYFFIWLITDNLESLTGSVLALIGISSATYLSSAALSSTKDIEAYNKRKELKKKISDLGEALQNFDMEIKASPDAANPDELQKQEKDKTTEKEDLEKEKVKLEKELESALNKLHTAGFLKDLVSDASGVSLHRFQIAVWTGVLGIIFVISVLESMAMPEFDTSLLALMGISGGTYIGFKFPTKDKTEEEKKKNQSNAAG